ncbi:hypothetical protein EB796_006223 [Bugula neritina]|uniref:Uncharacterized protein n=1 Tax=Bugula neritina TaxID=10212 RepID=A0A7J7K9Y7_BUGNE|nr:hypothetical protein EB796_006223 [Bugula neritina]
MVLLGYNQMKGTASLLLTKTVRAILQQLKNEEIKNLGKIMGIMVQDGYLYVCHHNGVGDFSYNTVEASAAI